MNGRPQELRDTLVAQDGSKNSAMIRNVDSIYTLEFETIQPEILWHFARELLDPSHWLARLFRPPPTRHGHGWPAGLVGGIHGRLGRSRIC